MIQRYYVKYPESIEADDLGGWCKSEDVEQLEALNKEMLNALILIMNKYGIPPKREGVKAIEKAIGKPIDEVIK